MMVSVETLPGLERRIEVSVPATRVRQQIDARLIKVSRTARIKGFRPGKAPIHVVRKHYGRDVQQEVNQTNITTIFELPDMDASMARVFLLAGCSGAVKK